MATQPKILQIERRKSPHNGEGRPSHQFKDPVTGEMIGGQVAYIRTAMRFQRFVAAWARRQGKALDVDTAIPTPGGWRRIGDLVDGDDVFDDQGRPCRIITAHPVLLDRPCYEVTFSDGARVVCDAEHLWFVSTKASRRAKAAPLRRHAKDGVMTTTELLRRGVVHRSGENNFRVPLCEPVQHPEQTLPIPPYALGVWLGDGTKSGASFTYGSADAAICDLLRESGVTVSGGSKDRRSNACTGRLSFPWQGRECGRGHDRTNPATRCRTKPNCCRICTNLAQKAKKRGRKEPRGRETFGEALIALNVRNNKHIPEAYLRASVEQRMDLLRGLMDTDGYAGKDGYAIFSQTQERLALQVVELLRGLGFCPIITIKPSKIDGRVVGQHHNVGFSPLGRRVFGLQRKQARVRTTFAKRFRSQGSRAITAITPVPSRPVRCLTVDSPSSLYLCSTHFIPTHNTSTRPFLYHMEQAITSGTYYAGMLFPDHTTAHKIWAAFKEEWGDLVIDSHGDDKSQNRWIQLRGVVVPKDSPAPAWFTPGLAAKWERVKDKPNTGARIYFWSGQHPYYQRIQGFTHPFHRISPDEAQQIHPGWRKILMPMLRDSRGFLDVSGTPDVEGEGNAWFEEFFENGQSKKPQHKQWASLRFPDGTNPHVPKDDGADADLGTEEAIRQARYAEFLTDQGSVFRNLDAVFTVPYLKKHGTDEPLWAPWLHEINKKHPIPSALAWFCRFDPVPQHVYGITVDWARSPHGDSTVVEAWNLTIHRQEAMACWRGQDFTQQMEWVLAFQEHFGARQCHADQNGMGEAMADFMRRRHASGFVGHKFGRNKADYVRKGQVLFVEGEIQMLDVPTQRREFKTFREIIPSTDNSESVIRYTHAPGGHDDFVAAFLQIAPTLTIIGRQDAIPIPEEAKPAFDDRGRTTLSIFGESVFDSLDQLPDTRLVDPSRAR
jgi:hypothetical protein